MAIVVGGAAKRGIDVAHGVDKVLWDRTEHDGKTRTTLEKPEDALTAFIMSSDHEKTSFLDYPVNPPTTFQNDVEVMIKAWHDHDDGAIRRILDHRLRTWPIGFEKLIPSRNQA